MNPADRRPNDSATSHEPSRRRRRVPWRLIVALILVTTLGVVVFEWFRAISTARRLDEAIAARRAKGEPVTPDDFQPPPLADADNAAVYLRRAEEAIRMTERQEKFFHERFANHVPLTPQEQSLMRDLVAANAA